MRGTWCEARRLGVGGVCRARGVNMIPSSSAAARATRVLWPTSLGFLLRVERESVGECATGTWKVSSAGWDPTIEQAEAEA